MFEVDEKFMARCLELARCGRGNTSPNPMVGAVIVHNGKIIGEGYHRKCGEGHAEVNAIASVRDKRLLKDSCWQAEVELVKLGAMEAVRQYIAFHSMCWEALSLLKENFPAVAEEYYAKHPY